MAVKVDIDYLLELHNQGKTNKQIADILKVSTRIIKSRLLDPDKWR